MIEGRIIEAMVHDEVNRIVATRYGWSHQVVNPIVKAFFRVPSNLQLSAIERRMVLTDVLEAIGLPKGRTQ